MDIVNGVIQVLDQLRNNGQLNDYLIDDDETKWTKLVYDIMVNKFDMPFGKSTMQQASEVFNNVVRVWKGKNKVGNMMNMESKQTSKKLIRLTESDLHRMVNEAVQKILKEGRGHFGGIVDMATEKFNEFYMAHKNETDAHINKVKASGDFKDLETRLAWDIARATRYMDWMPKDEQGYTAGNDAQITTLFKQALRNSSIEY